MVQLHLELRKSEMVFVPWSRQVVCLQLLPTSVGLSVKDAPLRSYASRKQACLGYSSSFVLGRWWAGKKT